jgi:hypothetical protein
LSNIAPQCLSMLVAQEVRLDPVTQQASIIGVIHTIVVSSFPDWQPRVVIWAELTGGRGDAALLVTVIRLGGVTLGEEVVTEVRLRGRFTNPRSVYMVTVTIDRIRLAEPGVILFRLSYDGSVIMERRVQVIQRSSAEERA